MKILPPSAGQEQPAPAHAHDKARRMLLAGILGSYVCSFIPLPAAFADNASPAGAAAKASENFLSLSRLLTDKKDLNPVQADRLYAAFVSVYPDFEAQLQQLSEFISAAEAQTKLEVSGLQAALDAQKSPVAKLPGRIVSGWYVGVVGSGKTARCVTYETSLMYVAVADRLKPPSYAYGPYGSWGRNPLAA
ncbi:hypothetical protein FHW67_002789 [Herbaspirillum sp. Sphag1AN]|uniref:sugar dehydrogenase complex small subunit n=1 Tax=unclassified Herbaspirillum TaxID=2624150 RepID=UPI0016230331|nr:MULTISPECIES: sugar dehydrogenase complex small subunit [unclassified Herbaspirillum]MBB3213491.1 hypothetical protein [Herbaspirillum sp. Sphag1AN]MBB3246689.1 hypothetical protein [Herbaspirillum sp. Sphag64]